MVFRNALSDLMKSTLLDRKCHLLLSANLKVSIVRISDFAQSIGCIVYTAPRQFMRERASENVRFGFGFHDLLDIHLLSRSHYFLGTAGSTLSLFTLGRIAVQAPPHYNGTFFKLFKSSGDELQGYSHLCQSKAGINSLRTSSIEAVEVLNRENSSA